MRYDGGKPFGRNIFKRGLRTSLSFITRIWTMKCDLPFRPGQTSALKQTVLSVRMSSILFQKLKQSRVWCTWLSLTAASVNKHWCHILKISIVFLENLAAELYSAQLTASALAKYWLKDVSTVQQANVFPQYLFDLVSRSSSKITLRLWCSLCPLGGSGHLIIWQTWTPKR